jgi:hypothetical protein
VLIGQLRGAHQRCHDIQGGPDRKMGEHSEATCASGGSIRARFAGDMPFIAFSRRG